MPPSVIAPETFPEPYMSGGAPSEESIVAELEQQPLEFLQDMARSNGIDVDLYPQKHDLIGEIMRRRK